MHSKELFKRALKKEFLSAEEGQFLFETSSTSELMFIANKLRQIHVPGNNVTWQIDRNVNTTNACTANCKFCNFFRHPKHEEVYITDLPTYRKKIEETIKFGGDQLLLQGGHHPSLGLDFYVKLFNDLKKMYPSIRLHALGPPEIAHICKIGGHSHKKVLSELVPICIRFRYLCDSPSDGCPMAIRCSLGVFSIAANLSCHKAAFVAATTSMARRRSPARSS